MFSLEGVITEALIDDGDESMALDVARKVEVPVRFLDLPLLLELGGGFSIICSDAKKANKVSMSSKRNRFRDTK